RSARAVREVRAGAASRQDAADRVRAVRRREPAEAGRRETGDVRLPRLHAHLREDAGRALLGAAYHGLEADAGEAGRGQGPAAAAHASACPGAGTVARQRGARALRLLRRARQPQGGGGVPYPGDAALARGAAAPQPALPPGLEAHEPPGESVAAARPRDASLP